jgi:hypothetical protein
MYGYTVFLRPIGGGAKKTCHVAFIFLFPMACFHVHFRLCSLNPCRRGRSRAQRDHILLSVAGQDCFSFKSLTSNPSFLGNIEVPTCQCFERIVHTAHAYPDMSFWYSTVQGPGSSVLVAVFLEHVAAYISFGVSIHRKHTRAICAFLVMYRTQLLTFPAMRCSERLLSSWVTCASNLGISGVEKREEERTT